MDRQLIPLSLFLLIPLLAVGLKWQYTKEQKEEPVSRPRLESLTSMSDPHARSIATRKMRDIQTEQKDRLSSQAKKGSKTSSLAKMHGKINIEYSLCYSF